MKFIGHKNEGWFSIIHLLWSFFSQRVNQCFRDACHNSGIAECMSFIDCGHGDDAEGSKGNDEVRNTWKTNVNATACFNQQGGFPYGIYAQAVNLTTENSVITRYVYSLFWGFQVLLEFLYTFLAVSFQIIAFSVIVLLI